MRISSIRIGSFGAIRDRRYDVSGGLTVFYGSNESGKTTTMEFIRSVLVPNNKRNQYPERKKSDHGSLEYTEDGDAGVLTLEYRLVRGDIPSMPNGTDDPSLYRSVFAMDSSGLNDDEAMGRLKSRYLTVPGGDAMPAALDMAKGDVDSLVGKTSRSKSRINSVLDDMRKNSNEVVRAKIGVDAYGSLQKERSELESRLKELESQARSSESDRRTVELYASQKSNYETLAEYRRQLTSLGDFPRVVPEDSATHDQLAEHVRRTDAALKEADGQRQDAARELMGADPRAVSANGKRIDAAVSGLELYRSRKGTVNHEPQEKIVRREVRSINPLVYIGAALAVLGVLGSMFNTYIAFLVGTGAVLAVLGLAKPRITYVEERQRETAFVQPVPDDYSRDYEAEVSALMKDLHLMERGTEVDVSTLRSIREAHIVYSRLDKAMMNVRLEHSESRTAYSDFVSRFGGVEGYSLAASKTQRADRLESAIGEIERAISNAGLDPNVPDCPVTYSGDGRSEENERINRAIGKMDERLRSIVDDVEVERLMDRRESLKEELRSAVADGAAAMLSCIIAERACEDIYSSVSPGVTRTADRYLGMMTGGRYSLDTNPGSKDLSVRTGSEVKSQSQWSSGLRAQVMLAVKLAIAKEMGEGKVPMILDDVLLPFDSERKQGACRALVEVGSEMQVLMFTCDAETAEICSGLDGATVARM